jgi:hypothetical protein
MTRAPAEDYYRRSFREGTFPLSYPGREVDFELERCLTSFAFKLRLIHRHRWQQSRAGPAASNSAGLR